MSLLWVMANSDEGEDGHGHKELWQPGERAHFEYHCNESHDSPDAQAWYHSHRPVTVLHHNADDEKSNGTEGLTMQDRSEEGAPRTYQVRHDDGFEHTAWEDELHTHPKHFYRPEPPSGPVDPH